MLVKFKYKIKKQSLPKWTGLGGGVIKMCQSGQAAPTTINTPLPSSAPLQVKLLLVWRIWLDVLMKFPYLQGKGWRRKIHWRDWCAGALRVPAASVHHMIGIQCLALASRIKVLHALSDD